MLKPPHRTVFAAGREEGAVVAEGHAPDGATERVDNCFDGQRDRAPLRDHRVQPRGEQPVTGPHLEGAAHEDGDCVWIGGGAFPARGCARSHADVGRSGWASRSRAARSPPAIRENRGTWRRPPHGAVKA